MVAQRNIVIVFFATYGKFDKRAAGRGIYQVEIFMAGEPARKKPLYIGQSLNMLERCARHLLKLLEDPSYFGLSEAHLNNEKLGLRFSVLEDMPQDTDIAEVEEKEVRYIGELAPLSQLTTSDRIRKDRVEYVKNALNDWGVN